MYTKDNYLKRENMDDHPIDVQGKIILDLCKSASLRILNERTPGDMNGQFTRYSSRNTDDKPSVIDYALCSNPLRNDVLNFTVLPFTGQSDHCCISLKIKINIITQNLPLDGINKQNIKVNKPIRKTKYTYDKNRRHVYVQAIQNDRNIEMLGSLVERKNISTVEIDEGIVLVNNILLNAAKKANFDKIHKAHSRHQVVNTQDWFTEECRIRRNITRQHGRELSKNPFNKGIRKKYLDARTAYKRTCRKSEKSDRQKLTHKL